MRKSAKQNHVQEKRGEIAGGGGGGGSFIILRINSEYPVWQLVSQPVHMLLFPHGINASTDARIYVRVVSAGADFCK